MSDIETTETSLTITRTVDAPRNQVYQAFTTGEEIETWQVVGPLEVEVQRIEPEPGGVIEMTHRPGEDSFYFAGEFLEVVENERLVHTLQVVKRPVIDENPSQITIELTDEEPGCRLTFTEEGVAPDRLDDTVATWDRMLTKLDTVLES